VIVMTAERDMIEFFADRGSLLARATRDGGAPYLSKIQRAEPLSGSWRTVFENDAMFMSEKVAAGRMALVEYREQPLSGGAHDITVLVVDLSTGQKQDIDRVALSDATFRGGGGAPRRAAGGLVALGMNNISWTHANELAGGVVEAELRVATLTDPRAATVIGRSTEWIEPVYVDDSIVVYVLGGSERDEVRLRSIATGEDRRLTTFASPTQVSGRGAAARSGSWIGWLETKPAAVPTRSVPSVVTFEALNVATGELRSMDAGGPGCSPLTGNALAFAWSCPRTPVDPPAPLQVLDTARWKLVDIVRPGSFDPFGLQAIEGGFIWSEPVGAPRRVHFFTPAAGAFG
jgi:hypothetical protein